MVGRLCGAFSLGGDDRREALADLVAVMMRQVCCVCLDVYGHKPGPDADTHGHCDSCQTRLMAGEHYRDIRMDLGIDPQQVLSC